MAANPLFDFVSALALDLNRADVHLPSFPEVVLVSRLLVFANSAQYNPAGVRVQSLETAIGRLGFELVKSTAISLAVKQMFLAKQHKDIAPAIRKVWQKSMQHGAMTTAVAEHAKLHKETALDENGNMINGRTEKPNKHDILTGSRVDGTSFGPSFFTDMTCSSWTSSGEGAAMVGHHDRVGPIDHAWAMSWNSAHISKGCSQEALQKTGGDGLFYCFAE